MNAPLSTFAPNFVTISNTATTSDSVPAKINDGTPAGICNQLINLGANV